MYSSHLISCFWKVVMIWIQKNLKVLRNKKCCNLVFLPYTSYLKDMLKIAFSKFNVLLLICSHFATIYEWIILIYFPRCITCLLWHKNVIFKKIEIIMNFFSNKWKKSYQILNLFLKSKIFFMGVYCSVEHRGSNKFSVSLQDYFGFIYDWMFFYFFNFTHFISHVYEY